MKKSAKNFELLRQRKLQLYAGLYKKIAIFLIIGLALLGAFLFRKKIINHAKEVLIEYSAYAGFKLKNLIIYGHKNIDVKELLSKLDADNNTPVFAIDLSAIQNALLQSDWVEQAIIARYLPNTIKISIIERTPIAIWQHKNELLLIDKDGNSIRADVSKFANLPIVVGQGANYYASTLLDSLSGRKKLIQEIRSATFVGNRRWNLNLKSTTLAKLPENNIDIALDYLEEEIKNKIDLNKLKVLDLRDDEKYYIEKY